MLKESFSRKDPADKDRRWFADDYFDLIVWLDKQGAATGFQLCYDKYKKERALMCTDTSGYKHELVDDGEADPAKNQTPIFVPDGTCPIAELIVQFAVRSAKIDPEVSSFVFAKLREYSSRKD